MNHARSLSQSAIASDMSALLRLALSANQTRCRSILAARCRLFGAPHSAKCDSASVVVATSSTHQRVAEDLPPQLRAKSVLTQWQADADAYEDWEDFMEQQIPGHVHLWDIRFDAPDGAGDE